VPVKATPSSKTHVARILDKLELQNRVQAAIPAYETGLVEFGTR